MHAINAQIYSLTCVWPKIGTSRGIVRKSCAIIALFIFICSSLVIRPIYIRETMVESQKYAYACHKNQDFK